MNLSRLLACLLGLAALALSFYAYQEYISLLGFPDGHVTELGAAEKKLASGFIALSLPLGLYSLWLGTMAGQRKTAARLTVAAGLYLLLSAGAAVVDHHLRSQLDGGIGG